MDDLIIDCRRLDDRRRITEPLRLYNRHTALMIMRKKGAEGLCRAWWLPQMSAEERRRENRRRQFHPAYEKEPAP